MESHLLLLPVVLLRCILLFFISIRRLWLLSFPCVRFVSSESRSESKWICLTFRERCWDSVCCRTVIFLSVYGNCFVYSVRQVLWIGCLSWRYILGGWALLYRPLFLQLLCTAVCHYLLPVISNLSNTTSCLLVMFLIHTVCVCLVGFHVSAALRRRQSRSSWRLGKLCTTPGLNLLGPESFAGNVVPTVGSWRARRYCTLPETHHSTKQTSWLLTVSRVKRPLTLYF